MSQTALSIEQALWTLTGLAVVELLGGQVRLLFRGLSGTAVCALLPPQPDGIMRIVVDATKPDYVQHVKVMLRESRPPTLRVPRIPAADLRVFRSA